MCCASLFETVTGKICDSSNISTSSGFPGEKHSGREILTHKFTHRERFLQSLSATWQPPRECKSLIIRVCLDCHGRGRGFESRRPRHSFQSFAPKEWPLSQDLCH